MTCRSGLSSSRYGVLPSAFCPEQVSSDTARVRMGVVWKKDSTRRDETDIRALSQSYQPGKTSVSARNRSIRWLEQYMYQRPC